MIVVNGCPLKTGTSTGRTRMKRTVVDVGDVGNAMSVTVVLPIRPMPLRRNDSYWLVRVRGRWYCGLSRYGEVPTSLNW